MTVTDKQLENLAQLGQRVDREIGCVRRVVDDLTAELDSLDSWFMKFIDAMDDVLVASAPEDQLKRIAEEVNASESGVEALGIADIEGSGR